jgi:acyl-coenzyme A thioesterase PaaI-like protein
MSREAIYTFDAGGMAHASTQAAGPWDATVQHGGAPAALIARAVERFAASAPMRLARLTIDLMRPVPVAPLAVRTDVVREGRAIQVLAVDLFAGDKPVARATALRIRAADNADAATVEPFDLPPPERSSPVDRAKRLAGGFMTALDIRMAAGAWHVLGPAAAWYRFATPLFAGEEATATMCAAAVADTSSGVSAALPFEQWTFINADLTVSFARAPAGEWLLVDARTWIGPDGTGITRARLADRNGWFGASVQSLVVERRR